METLIMTPVEEMTATANYTVISNDTITAKDSQSPRTIDYWAFDGVILGA